MKYSIPFLLRVWGHSCQDGDTVYLSTKTNGRWKDHALTYERGLRKNLREWFQIHPSEICDIYFCASPFRKNDKGEIARKKQFIPNVNSLWSDIDDGKAKLKPTYLWESSPGRLQGLWFLSGKPLPCHDGEKLNKALTYYMDADKGGWDLTQALRVPGTHNHKYDSLPQVRMLEDNTDTIYSPSRVSKRIGFSFTNPDDEVKITHTSNLKFEQVFSKHRRQIPIKVRRLLTQKTVTQGNRSDILWYMENKLNEAGLTAEEIICLVKHSAWNKFAGRADEDVRLRTELEKIIESKVSSPSGDVVENAVEEETNTFEMQIEDYYDLMSAPDKSPGWLVKGFWLNKSHGIVAGEPKSFKSTLALDLAISVASGQPFLGKHEVVNPGPVVYIQNENSKWIMKDRIGKISAARGVVGEVDVSGDSKISLTWPPNIPLYMVNQQSYLLTDPLHQKILEEILAQYKPVLVILDPLYLMFDGDIGSAKDLAPILQWLLDLRYRMDCGIMLIHHFNKGNGNGHERRGGQRMLGSTTLHGWIESAWYVQADPTEATEEEPDDPDDINTEKAEANITIEREFRGAGLHPKADLTITMGQIGTFEYNVKAQVHVKKEEGKAKKKNNEGPEVVDSMVLSTLHQSKYSLSEEELSALTGYSVMAVRGAVDRLTGRGKAKRNNRKIKAIVQ